MYIHLSIHLSFCIYRNARGPAGRIASTTSRAASVATGSISELCLVSAGGGHQLPVYPIGHFQNKNSGRTGRKRGGRGRPWASSDRAAAGGTPWRHVAAGGNARPSKHAGQPGPPDAAPPRRDSSAAPGETHHANAGAPPPGETAGRSAASAGPAQVNKISCFVRQCPPWFTKRQFC